MPQSDPLDDYVRALDEQRKAEGKVEQDVHDAALAQLQELGGQVVWPVDDGEWLLRAERDEDGPFIDRSFTPA